MKTKPKLILFFVPCLLVLFLLVLVACAPRTSASQDSGGANQEESGDEVAAVTINYSASTDCTACHTPEAESYQSAAFLASEHTANDCLSCHDDLATLTSVHASVKVGDKTASRLTKTEVSDEICLSCHSGEERILATANLTVLTDSDGTTVNPHAIPENSDHAAIACADCHKMHKDEALEKTAQNLCVGCHHKNVYECYTCHD
jgi:hypothetical protein